MSDAVTRVTHREADRCFFQRLRSPMEAFEHLVGVEMKFENRYR